MKLGVVITEKEMAGPAIGLLESALQGNELRCFLTDSGVKALSEERMRRLIVRGAVDLAVCELSMERFHQQVPEEIAGAVIVGGQYQNAELVHWCDRVLVF